MRLLVFQKRHYFIGMDFGFLHGGPMLDHVAFGSNDDRGADGALHLFAVHQFFAESAVLFHHLRPRIGEQSKRQLITAGELIVRLDAVLADANYDGVCLFELWIQLAEPASLLGSTRCAILRIEKQHDGFAFELV